MHLFHVSGITHVQYRQLQRGEISLEWVCHQCQVAEVPGTPVITADNDIQDLLEEIPEGPPCGG